MRAEEGDESIGDYADEAAQTQDRVTSDTPWWRKLLRALTGKDETDR